MFRSRPISLFVKRFVTTLTPGKITELLTKNETQLINKDAQLLPSCIKSIECNQLASNNPIEDRLRVSSLQLPGTDEPTLLLGIFDGHGGGTTADLISRRLFNYIALSLCPEKFKISNHGGELKDIIVDLHTSPKPIENPNLEAPVEWYKSHESSYGANIAANLKASFKNCDDDLSKEIQANLTNSSSSQSTLHYYLSAAVSGCCAVVMVLHQGIGYLASVGDCRAVLGVYNNHSDDKKPTREAIDLNDEHNCDNIDEIRRLAAEHPKSEQNTMIKHNRLLGHLMPFRAFGDFNYKWPADLIKACGITRAFGSGVIPSHYDTPPYLIAEPDVREIKINDTTRQGGDDAHRCLVIASDGLWELFESSRDVIETVVDHSTSASQHTTDPNCATHLIRSALSYNSHGDCGKDPEELKRLHHLRLESTLTLPQSIVRNFRDDISIIVLKL